MEWTWAPLPTSNTFVFFFVQFLFHIFCGNFLCHIFLAMASVTNCFPPDLAALGRRRQLPTATDGHAIKPITTRTSGDVGTFCHILPCGHGRPWKTMEDFHTTYTLSHTLTLLSTFIHEVCIGLFYCFLSMLKSRTQKCQATISKKPPKRKVKLKIGSGSGLGGVFGPDCCVSDPPGGVSSTDQITCRLLSLISNSP